MTLTESQRLARLGATLVEHPRGPLRVLGRLPTSAGVAIVGARRADPYGRELAVRLARRVVSAGRHVVSGGAFGVDAAAHAGALDAGGETVVVLGSGLDRPSPAAHRELFGRAAGAGAVVSPFPCDTRAGRWTFPRRNPWIADLACAVVVVQASAVSGALYTARAGLELGRPVFVVPGAFDNPLHAGCHLLVAEGARLLTDIDQVAGSPTEQATAEALDEPGSPDVGAALWAAASDEPVSLQVLATRAELGLAEAASMAVHLEIDGWLRPAPGGRFRRAR